MQPDDTTLDALIESSARMLQLTIEPEWMAAIKQNLSIAYRLAGLVEQVKLPDEAEPAPVYEA